MATDERTESYTIMVMEDSSLKMAISCFLIGDTSHEAAINKCELRVQNTAALYCSCHTWWQLQYYS